MNWTFGTILRRSDDSLVMVIGKTTMDDFTPTDGNSDNGLGIGEWIGTTLHISIEESDPWGQPGDTTWLLDHEWEIVE